MKHQLLPETLGPNGAVMVDAIQACVHCGFCLTTCPTYKVLGEEMDSPRGRIVLMKEVLEGHLDLAEALPHIDRCLGCLACETACPSGVEYRNLISPFRERAEPLRKRTAMERMKRWMIISSLPYPARFRLSVATGRLARPFRRFLPKAFRPMLDLLPGDLPPRRPLPRVTPAEGTRRARVALLAGCVQRVLDPDIAQATVAVLARNGVEVVVPKGQGCCGALAWHIGDGRRAGAFARTNVTAFPADVDAIVTNAAGCGSGMQEYGSILAGTKDEAPARDFAARVVDVAALLDQLGMEPPPALSRPLRVAYHGACHLQHAQQVDAAPRRLLSQIPGVELVPVPDAAICCGSAGTYNIDQPETAAQLGQMKADHLLGTRPDLVVSGNIGCMVQIRTHLTSQTNHPPRVIHTMQALDEAYRGQLGEAGGKQAGLHTS
jgi:glycolate oxidase iron-sulfur subunit